MAWLVDAGGGAAHGLRHTCSRSAVRGFVGAEGGRSQQARMNTWYLDAGAAPHCHSLLPGAAQQCAGIPDGRVGRGGRSRLALDGQAARSANKLSDGWEQGCTQVIRDLGLGQRWGVGMKSRMTGRERGRRICTNENDRSQLQTGPGARAVRWGLTGLPVSVRK